jgi:pyruvate formate lyase activating enzyme
VYYDIKSLDDEKHYAYTGVHNKRILENLISLCYSCPGKKITVRTPVIPGFNDSNEDLKKIETFLIELPIVKWEKLPYHTYGVGKYEMLGRKYSL